jgi:hypothetical protein
MEPKIEIHNNYCAEMGSTDIEAILAQITALVTDAVLRANLQANDKDTAA